MFADAGFAQEADAGAETEEATLTSGAATETTAGSFPTASAVAAVAADDGKAGGRKTRV